MTQEKLIKILLEKYFTPMIIAHIKWAKKRDDRLPRLVKK